MPKDLRNKEDVKESKKALESSGFGLQIENGKTPVYLLSSQYEDGYVHWIRAAGTPMRVACGGGLDGKGFAPDTCPICKWAKDMYLKARSYREAGKEKTADKIKNYANDVSAKYEAHFLAAKGEIVRVKTKTGEKKMVADYEDAEVGVLALTKKRYQDLIGLLDGDKYPFLKSETDLVNRTIILNKGKVGDAKYATVEFIPSRNETPAPEVEFKFEDFINGNFEIDEVLLKKAYKSLIGGKGESEKKSKVKYEDEDGDDLLDDEDGEEFDDDSEGGDFDDSEDEDTEYEGGDDEVEDSEFDDDFLDDIDDFEEEEEKSTEKKVDSKKSEKKSTKSTDKQKSRTKVEKKSASKKSKTPPKDTDF